MATDMTLLWGSGSPPCWRIQIVLEEKNIKDCKGKMLSFEKMEHKSPEVMCMNPRGQLPAFKHGNCVLNESFAACLYLENQYKAQGNQLIPDNSCGMAMTFQRMFEGLTLGQKMADVIYYNWKVPEGERHDSAVARNREALKTELNLWEGYVGCCSGKEGGKCFLAGDSFSLADVTLFTSLAYLYRFGLCESSYPKLAKYYNCLKDRPSIKKTWPPTWDSPGQDMLKDL